MKNKLEMWIVWHLPKWLVYWASVRLLAHATTGKWGNELTPSVTSLNALKRWHE